MEKREEQGMMSEVRGRRNEKETGKAEEQKVE